MPGRLSTGTNKKMAVVTGRGRLDPSGDRRSLGVGRPAVGDHGALPVVDSSTVLATLIRTFPVDDRVAFGSGPRSAPDLDAICALGYTHVIDCRQRSPIPSRTGPGPIHERHGISDGRVSLPSWWFTRGVRVIDAALSDPHAKVLICCAQGRRRSPALVYAYLRQHGMPAAEAAARLRSARPSVSTVYFASADSWFMVGPRAAEPDR